jgi:glutaredoxin
VKAEVTRRLVAVADSVNQNRQHANPDENSARPLFEVPVGLETGEVVPLRLYEGDDLQAAISKFVKTQNIPNEFVPHLFEEVKKRVTEKNDDDEKQPVFDFPVTFDGETEHWVVLRPGDVVQDVVARISASLALSEEVEGGATSLPKIFIGGQCIGGCSELAELASSGELDAVLSKARVPKKKSGAAK